MFQFLNVKAFVSQLSSIFVAKNGKKQFVSVELISYSGPNWLSFCQRTACAPPFA